MSRKAKRTRTTPKKGAASDVTIREEWRDSKSGGYVTHLVQGWKENGKWKRKRFKNRSDAERFAALKRVEQENEGRQQRMVLSSLTDEQH